MKFLEQHWQGSFRPGVMLTAMIATVSWACCGQDLRLESAGARFGFYPWGAGSHFYQAEAFADWNIPWTWDLGSHWQLLSRADASVGWLGESGNQAAIASLGPTFVARPEHFPLSFELGTSASVLTRTDFPSKDFGIPFQVISHAGLNFDLGARFRLSYRFQHMSNAGLSSHNPGLNLQMVGLSYLF